ncbi:hypothetical protein [Thioalkalivibrio nitratireducens]|uniref:hypothetical protein n=1 Tax=Thioalkalivibrio nitratireducens TaxID=186931 RepID=UPI001F24FD03|nr:hypothetical protein [Thioalkalivibrio nitratireducens]
MGVKERGPASRATRRAEERSVIRRSAFAHPRRLRQSWRRMADDGLRPLPPYAGPGRAEERSVIRHCGVRTAIRPGGRPPQVGG